MKKSYFKLSAISLGLLAAQQGLLAQEQELTDDDWGLEEIVVTAQKRSEPLQTTPVAVTAISSDDIVKFDIQDATDIDKLVPALSVTNAATSSSSLLMTMRGVGIDDSQIAVSPAVGTYIDGVYAGQTMGLNAEIVDLENIEVLRGPQGTLYGRNTTGGAINLLSAKPSETMGGELNVSAGGYGYSRYRLRVDSGEYSGFSSRLALSQSKKDGWRDNETVGASYDFGGETKSAARIALMYKPNDDITLDYTYDYSKQKGPQAYFQLIKSYGDVSAPGTGQTIPLSQLQWTGIYGGRAGDGTDGQGNPDGVFGGYNAAIDAGLAPAGSPKIDDVAAASAAMAQTLNDQYTGLTSKDREDTGQWSKDYPKSETEVQGHNFTASFQVNDYLTIKSVTGLRKLDESVFQEFRGGIPDLSALAAVQQQLPAIASAVLLDLELRTEQDHEQISEEIQFVGANPSDTLQYVAGLYYYQEEGNERSKAIYYNTKINVKNSTYAAFGQATYIPDNILDGKMGFTLGARYTYDDREFTKEFKEADVDRGQTVKGKREGSDDYSNFTPNFMVSYQATDELFTYGKVMTGYKSGGFNARSTITAEGEDFTPYDEETLLAYELGLKSQWLDRRLRANFAIYQNEYDDKQVSQQAVKGRPWETNIINAANATINGFEMDLAAEVIEGLVLTTAYSFSKTKYDEVIDKAGDYGTPGADVSDNWENTFNPEHSITVSAEYRHDISIGEMAYLLSYDWRDEQYTTSAQYVVNPANPVPNPIDPVTPNLIPGNNKGSLIDDYGIVNARVSLSKVDMGSGMQAGIALWIKNVLDEEYVAYQIDGLTEGTLGTFGEPRTLGADFTVQF